MNKFIKKVESAIADPLASLNKLKLKKNSKEPLCKWTDVRNHTKHNYDPLYNNTGIATGRSYNIIVIDIDQKDNGMEEFKKYTDEHGHLDTFTVKTPNDGLHFLLSIFIKH